MLLVPYHSLAGEQAGSIDSFLRWASGELRGRDVLVSIHRNDLSKFDEAFVDAMGWTLVSAGDPNESQFFERVVSTLLSVDIVATNRPQTMLFYAMTLGIPALWDGPFPESFDREALAIGGADRQLAELKTVGVRQGRVMAGAEALELGLEELGWHHKLRPSELATRLGWAGSRRPVAVALYTANAARHRALRAVGRPVGS